MSEKLDPTEVTKENRDNRIPMMYRKREYSASISNYANTSLSTEEKILYDQLMGEISESNKIDKAEHIMLLDSAMFDYLRIKRLQAVIAKEGDVIHIELKSGRVITKANEAAYLLNAITVQFRNSMKELMLTRKEVVKKEIGIGTKDFASFLSDPLDAEFKEKDGKDNKVN